MFKFLDDEHLCGAAKLKKKAYKMIADGECGDITQEQFDETMDHVQPLMTYACRRGVKIGAAAVVAGVMIGMCADVFGPRIREAVMKKLSK
jgi:hypothetical protein